MFTSLWKLLCVASIASVALAQQVSIVSISNRSNVDAKSRAFSVILENQSSNSITEVALVIGASQCQGTCDKDPSQGLGSILYNGPYSQGSEKEAEIALLVPAADAVPGLWQLNLAHVYTTGSNSTLTTEYAKATFTVFDVQG